MKNLIMKKTRRWTIALIILFALGIFTSQNTSAQIETGFLLGTSINEMHGDASAGLKKKGLRTGLQIINWSLNNRLALQNHQLSVGLTFYPKF